MTTNTLFNTDGLHPHIAAMVATDALFSKPPTRLLAVSTDAKTVKGETDNIQRAAAAFLMYSEPVFVKPYSGNNTILIL